MASLDDSSLLQRSTKLPGTGSEMTGRPILLLGISLGKGGRDLLETPLAGVVSCIDDRTLSLLIRCASKLSEWCMVKAASVGEYSFLFVSRKELSTCIERDMDLSARSKSEIHRDIVKNKELDFRLC